MSVLLRGRCLTPRAIQNIPRAVCANSFSTQPNVPQKRARRTFFWLALSTGTLGLGYYAGAKYPPPAIPFLFSPYSTDVKNLSKDEEWEHIRDIEASLHRLPGAKELADRAFETPAARRLRESLGIPRASEREVTADEADYLLVRPFTHVPEERLAQQFTAGSLRGPGMFAVTPLLFSKTKRGAERHGGREGDTIAFVHVGKNLSGFEGVTHGGLIATMFDEVLARAAFYALPHMIGVTAKLEINYRKPVYANRYYVLESHVTDSEGRKAFVTGDLREPGSSNTLAQADAVFVEPKFAKYMSWVGGLNIRKLMEE